MPELIIAYAAAMALLLGVIAFMSWREDRACAKEHARYRLLQLVTCDHDPLLELPVHLKYPSYHESNDVIFHMQHGDQPAHVVSLTAREISEREMRELESRN